MASISLRREVLNSFKALHKTRMKVFEGDLMALQFARTKINEEFRKNKEIKEEHIIAEQVQLAKAVEQEMRTTVVQARETKPGVFEARFNSDTVKMENVPFQDCDTQIEFTIKGYKGKPQKMTVGKGCCQQQTNQS